jgi:carboxylesterase
VTARTLEPFDPALVAPWRIGDGPRGVLLVHGFAGTPPELRGLGEHLAQRGFRCHGPALPGHAKTPEALEATDWRMWAECVAHEFNELAQDCDEVFIAGQSMGAALSLHQAATNLRVRAVASLAAPLWLSGSLQHLLPVIQHVVRWYRPGDDVDLWEPEAVEQLYSYGIRPTRSINELRRLCRTVRDEVAQIRAPVLILHGARDRSVDPRCAEELERRLICSAAVERHSFPRSGHAISVDVDHETAYRLVSDWFERFSRAAVSGSSTGLAGAPSSNPARARERTPRAGAGMGATRAASRTRVPHAAQRKTAAD